MKRQEVVINIYLYFETKGNAGDMKSMEQIEGGQGLCLRFMF